MTPVHDTLDALTPALSGLSRPWWVIGSAAFVLHGIAGVTAADIDLLLDPVDASTLCRLHGFDRIVGGDDGHFASHLYARRDDLALPVELIAGLTVRSGGRWQSVTPGPPVIRHGWPVASYADLRGMCQSFNRPKDHARLALLPVG